MHSKLSLPMFRGYPGPPGRGHIPGGWGSSGVGVHGVSPALRGPRALGSSPRVTPFVPSTRGHHSDPLLSLGASIEDSALRPPGLVVPSSPGLLGAPRCSTALRPGGEPGSMSALGPLEADPALTPPTALTGHTPAPAPRGQTKGPDGQAKGRQGEEGTAAAGAPVRPHDGSVPAGPRPRPQLPPEVPEGSKKTEAASDAAHGVRRSRGSQGDQSRPLSLEGAGRAAAQTTGRLHPAQLPQPRATPHITQGQGPRRHLREA